MIKGTVMEIGKDDPSGLVDVLIQTTRDEIQRIMVNPLYRVVEISLPCADDPIKAFPSLAECKRLIKCSFSGSYKLTQQDEHVIGTLWAYLERISK